MWLGWQCGPFVSACAGCIFICVLCKVPALSLYPACVSSLFPVDSRFPSSFVVLRSALPPGFRYQLLMEISILSDIQPGSPHGVRRVFHFTIIICCCFAEYMYLYSLMSFQWWSGVDWEDYNPRSLAIPTP